MNGCEKWNKKMYDHHKYIFFPLGTFWKINIRIRKLKNNWINNENKSISEKYEKILKEKHRLEQKLNKKDNKLRKWIK